MIWPKAIVLAAAAAMLTCCGGGEPLPPPTPTPEPTPTLREIQEHREDAACGIIGRYLHRTFRMQTGQRAEPGPDCLAFAHATDGVLVDFTFRTLARRYTCTARVDFYETKMVLEPDRDWQCSPRLDP